MHTRRLISLVGLVALVASACAPTASTAPSGAASSAPAASSAAPASPSGSGGASATAGASPSAAAGANAELSAAEGGEYRGTSVEILGQWTGTEADNFQASLAGFAERTGISIVYGGLTNYETVLRVRVDGGNSPDLAQVAQPGTMRAYAEESKLIDLATVLDPSKVESDTGAFIDLAKAGDKLYGLFYRANAKSIVWYPVKAFQDAGYEIPETWEELVALSDRIVADGNGSPWCISMEHGDVSGWVATDWLEDILLRTAPAETYDRWMAHELPFNDPAALKAADYMKQIWFKEDYVLGGNTGINATWVGETQTPMFEEAGPKCWMHKQAAWIPDFWPKDANDEPLYTPGEDSAFFYFPPIDPQYGRPVLGAADQIVMFNDRPEVRAVLQYLAEPESTRGWIEAGGFIAANKRVPLDWYKTYPDNDLAKILSEATTLRFDASDSMPKEFGNGTFLKGMIDWVSANGENTEAIFQQVDSTWPSS